jgi:hypothetical protein
MSRRLKLLLDLLNASPEDTVGTSVRLPTNLRDAAMVAVDMGFAASTTELTVRGLQDALEAFAQRAALDAHYEEHPHARPDLAEIALMTAEIDGSPLTNRPELVRRAATEIRSVKDDATPDDVLIYAAGLAAATAAGAG